jgi:hypothetical protein
MTEYQSSSAESALEALGVSLQEATEIDQAFRQPRSNNRNVCICGHGESKHNFEAGRWFCKPARLECKCFSLRPVLEAEDIRPFICKTTGGGALHALTRGITALALMDPPKKITWTVDLFCDRCKSTDSVVTPVPVTEYGEPTTYPTGFDKFLCQSCREIIQDRAGE